MNRRHGYLLVLGTARDPVGMDRYHNQLPPIYAEHKGYRLVVGSPGDGATFLDGGLDNLSMMLARFPSPECISDFWWSDEYRKAYIHRKDAGRFSAVGLPGLDQEPDPMPGRRGFLVAMATPASPGGWRRFADPFITGISGHGGTVLADAGPEAIERLESLMPGSHIIVAMFSSEQTAKDAWAAVAPDVESQKEACGSVNVIALAGLPDDHPERLTQDVYAT
ncbi:MAG: DUF1330 domain-containing protein [Rhodospirillaceae bacterium]|jgi:uncharacterized protein (DUF1330 family)|nr:DUF1330 domain-containing protein [Rhodospirillaceae bacterium]MBT5242403.1 DUF1330 domain-containing protein [Rhodospirillaceae bacterium]MBT5567344.1 DUF1330 domain-containing protein [Rhodospirillaceae bacterium]MBT6091147.1 DUF1330 domain-containing protein [Rhodospirillaceae bacterium]MBT7450405.1 DUF1330 domain-containing protein [Rhodospirillaceae bacterium]